MVADALVYHPSVAHFLKYVATVVGRDKLLRALQYFSRFYAWYLYRTNHTPATIAPYDAIKKNFGLSRKLMRVGKNVEHFKAAAVAADSKAMDPLDASGIRPSGAAKRLQREAYRAWFAGLLCNTAAGLYTLRKLQQKQQYVNKEEGEGKVELKKLERERAATNIQLLSDICDLTIPGSALGYANFDDGFVGLAGTVSSLIGIWMQWKKTA
ncbi:MAG: hypothetical protein M1825_005348 [Sarcosagium campestre]|nr:MAG: hypothetical protein M1825_005348 [Sarcosagium campestre]